jgi:hypothetical protein
MLRFMVESEIAERIAARRAELDELEVQLAKQLAEVRAERDELAVAERVWHRMGEQLAGEQGAPAPVAAQVAGRGVLLVPHQARRARLGAQTGRWPLHRPPVTSAVSIGHRGQQCGT